MFRFFLLITPVLFVLSCDQDTSFEANDISPVPGPVNGLFAEQKPGETGIDIVNSLEITSELNYVNYAYIFNGGGVAMLDFDQDGLMDLYFVSTQKENKLYRNAGNWKFEDVTSTAGVAASGGLKSGVNVVDVNADGYPDIYLARTGLQKGEGAQPARSNELFINQQDGTFKEAAAQYGLDSDRATNHANFFDYDGDGDLDCYLLNIPTDFASVNKIRAQQTPNGIQRITTPVHAYQSDQLLRNDGTHFTDVTMTAGIYNYGYGLSSLVHDFNSDGRQDIYISNDYIDADKLYINQGNGTFTDQSQNYFRHTSLNSMGSDLADLNGDDLPDLVTVDMLADDMVRLKSLENGMRPDRYNTLTRLGYGHQMMRNQMQINNGNGFSEVGQLAGIAASDWSWGPLLVDFDNDGNTDVFISNGYRYDVTDMDFIAFTSDSLVASGLLKKADVEAYNSYLSHIPTAPQSNHMYRNLGDLKFENTTENWGLGGNNYSSSAIYGDLDNDGDADLVVATLDAPPLVYRNQAVEKGVGGSWFQISAVGSEENPGGYGLKATVVAGNRRFTRELQPVRGFLGSVDPVLQFGLGAVGQIDRIELNWADGKTQVIEDIAVNQRLTVNYQDAGNAKLQGAAAGAKLFSFPQDQRGLKFVHRENTFDDFDRQALIPRMLSREGPALVTGDLNGDGLDDVFLGGAAGTESSVFLQQANGTLKEAANQLPKADNRYEDVNALLLDFDGDGDNDLYVTSGGSAFPNGSDRYQDRLYRNDGGKLVRAALPTMPTSTGAVVALDYDADGDLDIIVGGRSVPGGYPNIPRSYLLENNNGEFSDVTERVVPEFANIGMVTSIAVGNIEGDDRPEIVIGGEWMPITIFTAGDNGYVRSSSSPAGSAGNWQSLLITDLDGDGQNEIVAGNEGTNSRYKPSPERKVRLYADDFDGNGMVDPILTVSDKDGRMVPMTTKAQFLKQLPGMKKKFVRTKDYAKASVKEIFTAEQLAEASTFELETVTSSVFRKSDDRWAATALPSVVQVSAVRAIRAADFNGDGQTDLLLVGNDYSLNVETGRMDGGNGVLLLNDGEGGWTTPPNRDHGLWASLDARRLAPISFADGRTGWIVANNNGPAGLFLEE
ncbi:VCBS repeat-containing protein [Neolewinella aurantiaca]|nr:VCBS repeat-containing protein [Neolewinella aurantiaca]